MSKVQSNLASVDRRAFIGGSDARIIMGAEETALIRLWREKRGEAPPGGPFRQPDRPARPSDGASESAMVRTERRPADQRRSTTRPAPGDAMDGGDA